MPKVSVIIPNYNYARYVGGAIDSVLAQTYPDIEIIVVDDGSTDASCELIRNYGDQIIAVLQKNQGVAAARNNGIKRSEGEFIAFLDADDEWMPEKIERQAQKLLDDPELGLVHVGIVEIDENGKKVGERNDGLSGLVAEQLLLFEQPVILGGGSGFMLRRSMLETIGGFDTNMSTSADWDLFYRIAKISPIGFIPNPLLKYRVHGSNMHSNIRVMEHDMMLGYEKAFESGATADRRRCYGNLHKTLAGSYFRAGKYMSFLEHAVKSIVDRPSNLGYFLSFPLRRIGAR